MEMDVPPLIHNSALRGTNTSKTNRIGGGGGEDERSLWGDRRAFHTSTGHENTVQGNLEEASLTWTPEEN